jgi:hypothetical protein
MDRLLFKAWTDRYLRTEDFTNLVGASQGDEGGGVQEAGAFLKRDPGMDLVKTQVISAGTGEQVAIRRWCHD